MSLHRFLIHLHLKHEYPGRLGPNFIWAIGVDTIFTAMVFWGISGLLMWWQLKLSRPLGLAVLLVSLACATILALSMNGFLTLGPVKLP